MTSGSRIGIVGAGVAGLACAKVLSQAGFEVEVFDKTPDVGGGWSATRRYPGLRSVTRKVTDAFSDHPMPEDYPSVPDGQQMQAYLAGYVQEFGLGPKLRLNTEVIAADPVDSGWLLEIRDETGGHHTSCDHLIVANGIASDPLMPEFEGQAAFEAAGGRLHHVSRFPDVDRVRDRSVVVVGAGSDACDFAEAVSHLADETSIVATSLPWKLPRRFGFGVDHEQLVLTRLGEAHLASRQPSRPERLLNWFRFSEANLDLMQERVIRREKLRDLNLIPAGRLGDSAGAGVHLATEGFTAQIEAGRIAVHRDTEIVELIGGRHGPAVRLSDGSLKLAEIVVCATGYRQAVPFLTPFVRRALTDDNGDFRLYRHLLPVGVANLSFVGYNSSAADFLTAEVSAHWIAGLLTGKVRTPSVDDMSAEIDERLAWSRANVPAEGHLHGASVAPFTLAYLDTLLRDLGTKLPLRARLRQWVLPLRASAYRGVLRGPVGTGDAARPLMTSDRG
ncbi:flavin-containing monooxygenase [Nocardia camponoti]|uniref:Monooxygenase n=1 Tax=Nocardia camponoti TaxID=1616106 RepID=A0A917QBK0_9NOCA|nr:NAD(P)/FAD-dependent oxidoreductase [Nocardia camponoti]GGK40801.1 monooxygenase [Nocardia camponoti]